jgi:phenylpropionate dioxygenase-like ring-hydroxylating dioxygenase large terminal subunit
MGADLAAGKVINATIECPLHGWRIKSDGRCVHIPSPTSQQHQTQQEPTQATVQHLRCEEQYGLIFAYWGEQPLFQIPRPPQLTGDLVHSKARTNLVETNYLSLSLNTLDTQHFEFVHNRQFETPAEIVLYSSYQIGILFETHVSKGGWFDFIMDKLITGTSKISMDCLCGNLMLFTNLTIESAGMVALQPIDDDHCHVYLVALKKASAKQTLLDQLNLTIAVFLIQGFLSPDIPALKNMRPFNGTLIPELDYGAEEFWKYWQQLPRYTMKPAHH